MKTFDITVIRTASQALTIPVEAESLEQAQSLALEEAGNHEFPGENESFYKVENCPKFERELIIAAASPFTSGETPYEEYEKLMEAADNGNENDQAIDYASIWEPIENYTVGEVIELIESNLDNMRDLVRKSLGD